MSTRMLLELKLEPVYVDTNAVRAKAGACLY